MMKKIVLIVLLLLPPACDTGNDAVPPEEPTATAVSGYPAAPPNAAATEAPHDNGYPAAEATAVALEAAATATPDVRPTLTPPSPGVDTVDEPVVSRPQTAEVAIAAGDGLDIFGTLATPDGVGPFPGVLLLHMLGSDRGAWQEAGLVDALLQRDYAVLAVDMRGHGDTGGSQDWTLAADDLQRAWDYLAAQEGVDAARTAVVGASIGANMALVTGAAQPAIDTVLLLSPGLDYRGVTTVDALAAYGARPLLLAASAEDSYAADSSRTLAETAVGPATLELYDGAGHGTAMFSREPGLTPLILDWLDQHLLE